MTSMMKPSRRPLVPIGQLRTCLAALLFGVAGIGFAVTPKAADVLDVPAKATQHPNALTSPLSGIAANGDRVLAVGPRGTILLSRDTGKTWIQIESPVSADLTTVRFGSAGAAWAVGHDAVVLRSDDRGETWSRVLDGRSLLALLTTHYRALAEAGNEEAGRVLREVEGAAEQSATPGVLSDPFLDIRVDESGEGFLAGAFGSLLRTTDGGKSWEPLIERAENDRRLHVYAIERTSEGEIFLAGEQGLVRRYERETASFTTMETPYNGTYFGLNSVGSKLIAYGLRGNALVSAEGAENWTSLALGTDATVVAALKSGAGRLVFVTQAGQVLLSDDGGASVVDAGIPRGSEVFSAAMLGPEQVALARVDGVSVVRLPSP